MGEQKGVRVNYQRRFDGLLRKLVPTTLAASLSFC